MKKILTAFLTLFVFCFMSGAVLACGADCDCGCRQGKKCKCEKCDCEKCDCDCGCQKTEKCDCEKCKCKKSSKRFRLFKKKQIKCNCEE